MNNRVAALIILLAALLGFAAGWLLVGLGGTIANVLTAAGKRNR